MKLSFTSFLLLAQVLGLTSAQSNCKADLDTFDDGTGINGARGKRCNFYKGKDCLAVAEERGLSNDNKRILLRSCRHACGFCGENTIVKECRDDSCQCKDTTNWQLTLDNGQKITCGRQSTFSGCTALALANNMRDAQVREYLTNCAASCQVCSPCADVNTLSDGFCDPGNNNEKCFTILRSGRKSAGFDGGDCCNTNASPFFKGDNSMRYLACARSNTAYDKQFCKCLAPTAARKNDCVGQFGKFGECSATCGTGVKTKTFIVLSPAKEGGHACEFEAGHTVQKPCVAEMETCPPPSTTAAAATTTTTTTTAATTTTTAATTAATTATTNINVAIDVQQPLPPSVATTATTLITTIACMIYLFL